MAKEAKKNNNNPTNATDEALALNIDDQVDIDLSDVDLDAIEAQLENAAADLREEISDEKNGPEVAYAKAPASITEIDAATPSSPPIAANDAHESELSTLIYSMQQKPNNRVFVYAGIVSVIWFALCIYYTFLNGGLDTNGSGQGLPIMNAAAVTIIPLMLFWAFAFVANRALEMRYAATSMMAAAVKLLQPEKISTDSIVMVGHAIRREVAAISEGMNQAMARAGELESMVQTGVMNLELSYGDSEVRLKRLVEEISNERKEVITHADQLRNAINTSSSGLASELELVTDKIENSIRSSTGSLKDFLETEGQQLTTKFTDSSQHLIGLLSDTGTNLNTNLVANATNFEQTMAEKTQAMNEAMATAGTTIASLLETRAAQISNATNEVETRLEATKNAFEINLGERTEQIKSVLDTNWNHVSNLLESNTNLLAEQGEKLSGAIDEKRDTFRTDMDEKIAEVQSTFNGINEQIGSTISTSTAEITARGQAVTQALELGRQNFRLDVDTKVGQIGTIMATAGNSVNAVLEASANNLSKRSKDIITDIQDQQDGFSASIDGKTEAITASLAEANNKIDASLAAGTQALQSTGDQIANQTADALALRTSEFASQINGIVDHMHIGVEENFINIDKSINRSSDHLVARLEASSDALGKVLEEKTSAIGTTIASELSGFDHNLTRQVDGAIGKLQTQVDKLEDNTKAVEDVIVSRTEKAEQSIKEQTIAFAQAADATMAKNQENVQMIASELGNVGSTLDDHFRVGAKDISDAFDLRQKELMSEIDSKKNALIETMDDRSSTFEKIATDTTNRMEARFAVTTEGLTELMNTSTEAMTTELQERANNLASKINQGVHQLSSTLEDKTSEITDRMERNVSQMHESLLENNENIDRQFKAGTEILNERMEKSRETLLDSITQTITYAGSTIDGKAEQLSDLLENRVKAINSSLGTELVSTQRLLEEKTEDFNNLLANRAAELNAVISEKSDMFSQVMDSKTSYIMNEFSEQTANMNSVLSQRSSELSGIIENQTRPLLSSLDTASANISDRLSGLSKLVAEEANALFGNLGQSSELLGNLVNEATSRLSTIQDKLDTQTYRLVETTKRTEANLNQTDQMAAGMGQQLEATSESLLGGLNNMAQRFEAQGIVLQDSTKLIDAAQSNFQATLESKQEALHALSSNLLSRSDEINNNISNFGSGITKMIDELSARSQGVGSSVASEVSKAIEDATSRFSTAVDQMRNSASIMRKELEETREQMRRGILELPDETEQSASAMRRVVNDQIEALRDLSALVEKSGRVLDVAPAKSSVQASATPSIATASAQSSQPLGSNMQLRGSQQFTPSKPMQRATPVSPVSPSVAPTNSEPEGTGWVSNLLRRASEGEAQPDSRSPNQVVDSLNALSLDIVKAIDDKASVELWSKYQNGERNVFTRRLNSIQGQQTHNEIRGKYGSEPEFRSAVNRYIEDFEGLLTDVAASDPSDATSEKYLKSDQGKVYTMLAHASGRFEKA